MCERLKDEATLTWLVRVCAKHPSALLSLVCMAATATMYCDNRASRSETLAAYREATELMSDVRAEMRANREHLRQLDEWHKLQYTKENSHENR